jgi:hypothetical protein
LRLLLELLLGQRLLDSRMPSARKEDHSISGEHLAVDPSWRTIESTQREIEFSGPKALIGGLGVGGGFGVQEDPGSAFVQDLKKPG